jgi:hypothetical protein
MNKNDPYKMVEALRRALELQNFNCALNMLSLCVSNERYAKEAIFEQRLLFKDRRLLKEWA